MYLNEINLVSPLLPWSAYTNLFIMLVMGIHMRRGHLCIHIILNRALEMTKHATISMQHVTEHNSRYFRHRRCNLDLIMGFESFWPLLHNINASIRYCRRRLFNTYHLSKCVCFDIRHIAIDFDIRNIDCHDTLERFSIGYIKLFVYL